MAQLGAAGSEFSRNSRLESEIVGTWQIKTDFIRPYGVSRLSLQALLSQACGSAKLS